MASLRSWIRWIRPASSHSRPALGLEILESRLVLYSVSGNAWPTSQLVTLSFVPDDTIVASNGSEYIGSNLVSKFNTKFGSPSVWQNIILRAAQSWAQQTNLNFAVVADDGSAIGSGSYQQGDPNKGDIRFGGYNFGLTNNNLGVAYMPPPVNNYSGAGDVNLNTNKTFNNGSTYDLFTVSAHEIGHALGLHHSLTLNAEMYGAYNGVKPALSSDDINGIRAIYSGGTGRTPDAYDAAASNGTISTATDVTSAIDPTSLTALLTGLDLTTTADKDYYTFTAPTGSASTLTVGVQSQGLSLLSPKLIVYAADGTTILGSAGTAGQYGATLQVTVSNVVAGAQYYVRVAGVDTTAFATGAYALTLNLGTGASPTVPLPNTTLANGDPFSAGGGQPLIPDADEVHGHVFSDEDHHDHEITSGSHQETVLVAAGATAFSPVVLSGLLSARQQSAPLPTAASRGVVETPVTRVIAPAPGDINTTGTLSRSVLLSGAGDSQERDATAEQGGGIVPVGAEKETPPRAAEPQIPAEPPPVPPQEQGTPKKDVHEPTASIESQAIDACFMTMDSQALTLDDATREEVEEGRSWIPLVGAAVALAVIPVGIRKDDAGEVATGMNQQRRARPRSLFPPR